MIENRPKRILIAPLDWGLGHTTRCLPIINYLQQLGCHVVVACNTWQRAFIERYYTTIEFVHIEGYNIGYSGPVRLGRASNLKLVPQVCSSIKTEQEWLQQQLPQLKIDAIISDNRYGLHSSNIPCVIMTHQLQVQTGMGAAANRIVQRLHYRFLEKFNEVWVPDVAGADNLAGELSHCEKLPKHIQYIGLLSQFESVRSQPANKGYLLVLLSGPEPQRSLLSDILMAQLQAYAGKGIFVAGSEAGAQPASIPENVTFHKTLAGSQLAEAIVGADMVICRSGYTTVMDLVLLGKKAILIPTPGQTEQEYLGEHLQKQGMFPYSCQHNFELNRALAAAQDFPYVFPALQGHYADYKEVVDNWLTEI